MHGSFERIFGKSNSGLISLNASTKTVELLFG